MGYHIGKQLYRSRLTRRRRRSTRRSLSFLRVILSALVFVLVIASVAATSELFRIRSQKYYGSILEVPKIIEPQIRPQKSSKIHAPADKPFESSANLAPIANTVYLTFDDGPDPVFTKLILEILKLNNIQGTFFVVGKKAEAYPGLIREVVESGNIIGNHSYEHDYNIYKQPPEAFRASIEKTQAVIGTETGIKCRLFRPPAGKTFLKPLHKRIIQSMSLELVTWNMTTGDGDLDTKPERMLELVRAQLSKPERPEQIIVLMHDDRYQAVVALQQIIDIFREQGYGFGVLGALVEF